MFPPTSDFWTELKPSFMLEYNLKKDSLTVVPSMPSDIDLVALYLQDLFGNYSCFMWHLFGIILPVEFSIQ